MCEALDLFLHSSPPLFGSPFFFHFVFSSALTGMFHREFLLTLFKAFLFGFRRPTRALVMAFN